jgi:hypothetical protein
MNEHDTRADGGDRASGLAVAMTRLADTMPDDPYRLEGVHARVRRLRARRRAGRAVVGVVAGAAAVSSFVAVRSGHDRVATLPAAQPSTESALPACHAALAAQAETPSTVPVERRGLKGYGTIVGAPTEASVAIHVDEPPTGQPSELTATADDETEFLDAGVVGPMPVLTPGDRVVFAVEEVEGGYKLLLLEVHPDDQPVKDTTQDVTDAEKSNFAQAGKDEPAEPAEPAVLKANAAVVSVQPGSMSLKVDDGAQAGQVIDVAVGPDTGFRAGDTKCNGTDVVAGDAVSFAFTQGADGTYSAIEVLVGN